MKITQGAFSFLPELTEDQIRRQVDYCLANDWAVSIEIADEIEPRGTFWATWGAPIQRAGDAAAVMDAIRACRAANPKHHLRINAVETSLGEDQVRLSFIINRPREASVFRLERPEMPGRSMRYRVQPPPVERRFGGMRG
jgi:ribulose-bisphosphate carboxylase small chain